MSKAVCNRDCFNCPYEDCVVEGESALEIARSERLDAKAAEAPGAAKPRRHGPQRSAYRSRYHREHRDKYNAINKAYYEAHRQEIAEWKHEYYLRNRERILAQQKEYRKRKRENDGTETQT